jgi:hypothetical protein
MLMNNLSLSPSLISKILLKINFRLILNNNFMRLYKYNISKKKRITLLNLKKEENNSYESLGELLLNLNSLVDDQ